MVSFESFSRAGSIGSFSGLTACRVESRSSLTASTSSKKVVSSASDDSLFVSVPKIEISALSSTICGDSSESGCPLAASSSAVTSISKAASSFCSLCLDSCFSEASSLRISLKSSTTSKSDPEFSAGTASSKSSREISLKFSSPAGSSSLFECFSVSSVISVKARSIGSSSTNVSEFS